MKPVLLKDFFLPEELVELNRIIDLNEHTLEEPDQGRLLHNLNSLQVSPLRNKIESQVSEIIGKKLKMVTEGYTIYKKEYGTPSLKPHIDHNETEYILDYHVYSNTEWPIAVEGEYFNLNANEAALFSGKNDIHWRPKKEFNDEECVAMIFFHFVDIDNPEAAGPKIYTDDDEERLANYEAMWKNGQ